MTPLELVFTGYGVGIVAGLVAWLVRRAVAS